MSDAAAAAGQLSLLLDIVPVCALLLLAIAFLRGRHRCRREEEELREKIRAFELAGTEKQERERVESDE